MTTQKEIDEMFIGILENISKICDKTTSGNVSHNIATIKYKCRDMLQFYKQYPVTHWHSVKEGDLPNVDEYNSGAVNDKLFVVKTTDGKKDIANFLEWFDEECCTYRYDFFDASDCPINVDYWIEIPKSPTD